MISIHWSVILITAVVLIIIFLIWRMVFLMNISKTFAETYSEVIPDSYLDYSFDQIKSLLNKNGTDEYGYMTYPLTIMNEKFKTKVTEYAQIVGFSTEFKVDLLNCRAIIEFHRL